MDIIFDPAKNRANFEKHGLDFIDVVHLDWENALVKEDGRHDYGEIRIKAFLEKDEKFYVVVFTLRNEKIRVISFRRARPKERGYFEQ